MRRELSLLGVSLLAYACALVLGSLIICEAVSASEVEVASWDAGASTNEISIEAHGVLSAAI